MAVFKAIRLIGQSVGRVERSQRENQSLEVNRGRGGSNQDDWVVAMGARRKRGEGSVLEVNKRNYFKQGVISSVEQYWEDKMKVEMEVIMTCFSRMVGIKPRFEWIGEKIKMRK